MNIFIGVLIFLFAGFAVYEIVSLVLAIRKKVKARKPKQSEGNIVDEGKEEKE